MTKVEGRVDQGPTHVRSKHWAAFRSGEWARILTEIDVEDGPCWIVEFPDGATDWWRTDDSDAEYEFIPAEAQAEAQSKESS